MHQNIATPKAIFTMWLQFHGRLLIADRLTSWDMPVEPLCSLLNQLPGTRDHLFAECAFTTHPCARISLWLHIPASPARSWIEMHQWVISYTKGRTFQAKLYKFIYAEFIHTVWLERNARVFEKKESSVEMLARQVACFSNIRAKGYLKVLLSKCKF
ncbi:uncharacterized protein LOC132049067 [Lycium ferocissimum]|uniref:uncharacterized protein LOC132049067 n=1 Tax=Lycium ferocissimum TaxID=112874 RepID=UPI00281515C8|nr:uncharacterized protein LOC132049067 [Lycium ferocissimum]